MYRKITTITFANTLHMLRMRDYVLGGVHGHRQRVGAHATHGGLSFLLNDLLQESSFGPYLEVGVWRGGLMASALRSQNHIGVEWWVGNSRSARQGLTGPVWPVPAASQQQGKRRLLGPGANGEPHGNTVPVPRLGTPGRSPVSDQEGRKFTVPTGDL